MKVIDIISRLNKRLNNDTYTYSDYRNSLDYAIDLLNTKWYIDLPAITYGPEMITTNTKDSDGEPILKAREYNNLTDEIIRMIIIPAAASYRLKESEEDNRPEELEVMSNLQLLGTRYKRIPNSGATAITQSDISYGIIQGDTSDLFGVDNDGYGGQSNSYNDYLNPFKKK